MLTSYVILAYFGPETVLPATSIIATVIGVVLMMGKSSLRWMFEALKRAAAYVLRRGPAPADRPNAPHAPHTAGAPSAARRESVEAR